MEHVRFGSDFKNQPRIGQRFIQSTAGAVSVKSKKGDLVVEKVNVKRYIAGKKPEWAPEHSSEEESEDEEEENEETADSPRQIRADDLEEELEVEAKGDHGQRRIYEPRVVTQHDSEDEEGEIVERRSSRRRHEESSEEEIPDDDDEELDENAIERRRQMLRARAQMKTNEDKDLLDFEDEEDLEEEDDDDDESSEYEEYSDSDDETGLRLKPVFVRKNDRVTIQERERMQEESVMSEDKLKKVQDERKRQSTRLVNEIVREDLKEAQGVTEEENLVITDDDENDEEEYEAWKVRELKRIKRDKEEKEIREKEQLEIERLHSMTEDERREELRRNPKVITNKSTKGKYKFLQKYYHRGAFFMDQEEEMFKRDFTGATLEDHFDKTVLPKAMQVKNFGRSGRTKYTHLVDQDTTVADSPWFADSAQGLKYHAKIGGGNKQLFEKPSRKKK